MNPNLGHYQDSELTRLARAVEQVFEEVPENARRTYEVTLNFAAPGAVPGVTSQNVTVDGAEVGDTVIVGAPVAAPAGFLAPVGEVTAANTVRVSWLQFAGGAAAPDGAGGVYRIDLWRH